MVHMIAAQKLENKSHVVKCKITEGGKKAVEIELAVPEKQQAIDICNKWYENPSKYYLEIIKLFS